MASENLQDPTREPSEIKNPKYTSLGGRVWRPWGILVILVILYLIANVV